MTLREERIVINAFRDKRPEIEDHKRKLEKIKTQLDRSFSSHMNRQIHGIADGLNDIKHSVKEFAEWTHRMESYIHLGKRTARLSIFADNSVISFRYIDT